VPHHNAGMDHNWATTKTAHTPERPAPCAPPQRRHGPQQTSHTHIHTHLRGKYSVPHHNAGMDHNERHTHTHTHTPERQVICIPPQRRQNFHLAAHLRGQHSVPHHNAGMEYNKKHTHLRASTLCPTTMQAWTTTNVTHIHTPERQVICIPPQRRQNLHLAAHLRGQHSVPHHNAGMEYNKKHTPERLALYAPPQSRRNLHWKGHSTHTHTYLRGQHSVSHDAGFTFRGAEGHVTQVDDASQAVLSIPHPNAVQVKKYEETRCLLQ